MLWDFCFRAGLLEHLSKKSFKICQQLQHPGLQPRKFQGIGSRGTTELSNALRLHCCSKPASASLGNFSSPKKDPRWNTPPRGDRENFCRHRPGIQRVPKKSSKSPEEILNTRYVYCIYCKYTHIYVYIHIICI